MALLVAFVDWGSNRVTGQIAPAIDRTGQASWRMPPLSMLTPGGLTPQHKVWMAVLRLYLVGAAGLMLWRIALLALGKNG